MNGNSSTSVSRAPRARFTDPEFQPGQIWSWPAYGAPQVPSWLIVIVHVDDRDVTYMYVGGGCNGLNKDRLRSMLVNAHDLSFVRIA